MHGCILVPTLVLYDVADGVLDQVLPGLIEPAALQKQFKDSD